MNCKEIESKLVPYLLNDLPEAEQEAIALHVEDCDRCQTEARELQETLDLLGSALAAPFDAPEVLDEPRRAGIFDSGTQTPVRKTPLLLRPVVMQLAALILLLLVSVPHLFPPGQVSPEEMGEQDFAALKASVDMEFVGGEVDEGEESVEESLLSTAPVAGGFVEKPQSELRRSVALKKRRVSSKTDEFGLGANESKMWFSVPSDPFGDEADGVDAWVRPEVAGKIEGDMVSDAFHPDFDVAEEEFGASTAHRGTFDAQSKEKRFVHDDTAPVHDGFGSPISVASSAAADREPKLVRELQDLSASVADERMWKEPPPANDSLTRLDVVDDQVDFEIEDESVRRSDVARYRYRSEAAELNNDLSRLAGRPEMVAAQQGVAGQLEALYAGTSSEALLGEADPAVPGKSLDKLTLTLAEEREVELVRKTASLKAEVPALSAAPATFAGRGIQNDAYGVRTADQISEIALQQVVSVDRVVEAAKGKDFDALRAGQLPAPGQKRKQAAPEAVLAASIRTKEAGEPPLESESRLVEPGVQDDLLSLGRMSKLSEKVVLYDPVDEPEGASEPVFRAHSFNAYIETKDNAFSTFSIDVDTAAYTLARRYMTDGSLPPPDAVRTEEFLNFFRYNDPAPKVATFAAYAEAAPNPLGSGTMLKVGVKGKRIGREEQRKAHLTFVIDTSGSMDTNDRLGLARRSLKMLVEKLGAEDQVAIVQVSSQSRLVLEHTPASQRQTILDAIDALQVSGSTHLEQGITMGYQVAERVFDPQAMNRVLLLSDGAANLGTASADEILQRVEHYRDQGIFCSIFGFGIGTYNDVMLETLANKGNGSYQFIDSEDEARRVFVEDLSATLNTIASDVKIQVEFNPERVQQYRQLGYENRQLSTQQFRDDSVDAGEVGSGQSVSALYALELKGDPGLSIGTLRLRYRNLDTGEVEEITRPISPADLKRDFGSTDVRFRLAVAVASFAEKLRGSPFTEHLDYQDIAAVLRPVAMELELDPSVQELSRLLQLASTLPRASE